MSSLRNAFALTAAAALLVPAAGQAKSGADHDARPNVIVILADDLAYSDLGVYGGEIETPNIDALAAKGMTFTYFHTTPMCSPSRAVLLTGEDQHRTGFGTMAEFLTDNQRGQPGYELYLNDRVSTIPEEIGQMGYRTYMSGKWHLGRGSLPPQRGFDRSFYLIQGAASHYENKGYARHMATVQYQEDGEPVDLPENFYSSDFYTQKLISYIDAGRSDGHAPEPFFGYLAYTAPHFPLQAPADLIEKYLPVYEKGWDRLREERMAEQIRLGIFAPGTKAPESGPDVPKWDELTADQQAYQAKVMATYAGMVENIDTNVGHLVEYLKRTGQYENTIIIFSSDNGPEALDLNNDYFLPNVTDWIAENYDNGYDSVGSADSFVFLGEGWASAAATAHKLYKDYVTEGGTHSPLIVSYPAKIEQGGGYTRAFTTLLDIMPTVIDAADGDGHGSDMEMPEGMNHAAHAMHPEGAGKSLLPYLTGHAPAVSEQHDGAGFELFGNEAYIMGDWKVMRVRQPKGSGEWAMYNLAWDPGEQNDLSKTYPVRFAALRAAYDEYSRQNGIILPPDDFSIIPTGGSRPETSNPVD